MKALAVVAVVLLVVLALLSLWGLGFYAVWKAFRDLFWDN